MFTFYFFFEQGYRRGDMYTKDHLSPPSSVTRLSDSDMSEFDLDDGMGSVAGKAMMTQHLSFILCITYISVSLVGQ